MTDKQKKDQEKMLIDIGDVGLKEFLIITISVIIGGMMSLYINTKYGTSIFNLGTKPVIDLVVTSVVYITVFFVILILLALIIKAIFAVIDLYFEPLNYFKKNRIKIS